MLLIFFFLCYENKSCGQFSVSRKSDCLHIHESIKCCVTPNATSQITRIRSWRMEDYSATVDHVQGMKYR